MNKEIVTKHIDYILSHTTLQDVEKGKIADVTIITSGTEAKVYLIKTKKQSLILKLMKLSKRDEIAYENAILKELNSFSNDFMFLVSDSFILDNQVAVLYKYFDGKSLRKTDITNENIIKIAHMQAKMHKILVDFKPKTRARKRFSIFDYSFTDVFKTDYINSIESLIEKSTSKVITELDPFKNISLPNSIIHEDLELVNILKNDNGDLLFIDFGESHKAPIISDIATTIKEIIVNTKGLDLSLFCTYIQAYQEEYPILDQTQIDMLYGLILRRTLFMLTYLFYKGLSFEDSKGYSCNIEIEKEVLELLLNTGNFNIKLNNISVL